jgi:hypothetical protein
MPILLGFLVINLRQHSPRVDVHNNINIPTFRKSSGGNEDNVSATCASESLLSSGLSGFSKFRGLVSPFSAISYRASSLADFRLISIVA